MTVANWAIAGSNLFTALLVAALSVPMLQGRVRPNRWYGVRFSKTFESEEAWYAINRYGGRVLIRDSLWVAAAGIAALVAPAQPFSGLLLALALAPLVYLVSCWGIWSYARRWPEGEDR